MYARAMQQELFSLSKDYPVVSLMGPRQSSRYVCDYRKPPDGATRSNKPIIGGACRIIKSLTH